MENNLALEKRNLVLDILELILDFKFKHKVSVCDIEPTLIRTNLGTKDLVDINLKIKGTT